MQRKAAAAPGWTSRQVVPLATIREITERDVPRVLALYSSDQPANNLPGSPPEDERERAAWLKDIIHRGFNFVAEEEGRLVAHLSLIRVGDTAQVSAFVHPDSRRRGIGSTLLRVAIDQARDMGLRHIWIAIPAADRPLQDLLLHFGFAVSGRTEDHSDFVLSL